MQELNTISSKSTMKSDIESIILDKLQKTLLSDDEQIKSSYQVFVETLIEEREVLKEGIRRNDVKAIRIYAHKNKSSLHLGGLSALGNEAEELEGLIDSKATKPVVLGRAMNHLKSVDQILIELNKK